MKTSHMNENDVMSTMTLCKDRSQRSCDVVNKQSPMMSNDVKGIIDVLKKKRCQSHDETDEKFVTDSNEMCCTKSGSTLEHGCRVCRDCKIQ